MLLPLEIETIVLFGFGGNWQRISEHVGDSPDQAPLPPQVTSLDPVSLYDLSQEKRAMLARWVVLFTYSIEPPLIGRIFWQSM